MIDLKLFLPCFYIACLLAVIHTFEQGANREKKNLSKESTFTLTSIEDVEMLTYFLLWKHDYFDNAPDLNSVQGKLKVLLKMDSFQSEII